MSVIKKLFDAQTVEASGNATSVDVIYTGNTDHLDIYIKNTGASANCTIQIYGGSHKDKSSQRSVTPPFTLGSGGKEGISVYDKSIPSWCWAEILNSDSSNSAIVDVELEMW